MNMPSKSNKYFGTPKNTINQKVKQTLRLPMGEIRPSASKANDAV